MADHRHKRDTEARRKPTALAVIAPLAVLATAGAVTVGVVAADPAASGLSSISAAHGAGTSGTSTVSSVPSLSPADALRDDPVTRAEDRTKHTKLTPIPPNAMSKDAIRLAIKGAEKKQWTTDTLNLWNQPGEKATQLGEIEAGTRVLVTGRTFWGRTEIVVKGESRWVTTGYLSDEEPPTLGGDCENGTSVDPGVSDSIKAVHQAVCANFPDITVYGTLRGGGGDHPLGKAVDIMVRGEEGYRIAEFVRENAAELGVSYVIWAQRIWSVQRSGEGWRGMSSRGSDTANHFDHVHVSVY